MISTSSESRRFALGAYFFAFTLIAVFGAVNLPFPFVSDQVVAMIGARTIAEGGTLYVDFWDNKMPGLLWFYRLGCGLFGFDELGYRATELVWQLVFSVVLMAALARYLRSALLASVAAIAVVGTYYAAAIGQHLGQLEIIVGLPLFVTVVCLTAMTSPGRRTVVLAFATGLLAGVTVVFKLIFAPVFVAFWLITSAYGLAGGRFRLRDLATDLWLPAAAGTGLVLAAVCAIFWTQGALEELLWTAFVYPPKALAKAPPASYFRLLDSFGFLGVYFAAWWVFLARGAFDAVRHRSLFYDLLLAWLVVGLGMLLLQRFSWWQYHFLLLFPPIGILAVRGLQALVEDLLQGHPAAERRRTPMRLALAAPAVLALIMPLSDKVHPLAMVAFQPGVDFAAYRAAIVPEYGDAIRTVRFLRERGARQGPIYAIGMPLVYHVSGRRPALPMIGWPWEFFLDEQWVAQRELIAERRPAYIFVHRLYERMIRERVGAIGEFVDQNYVKIVDDPKGTWFALRSNAFSSP